MSVRGSTLNVASITTVRREEIWHVLSNALGPSLAANSARNRSDATATLSNDLSIARIGVSNSLRNSRFQSALNNVTRCLIYRFRNVLCNGLKINVGVTRALIISSGRNVRILTRFFCALRDLSGFLSLLRMRECNSSTGNGSTRPFNGANGSEYNAHAHSAARSNYGGGRLNSIIRRFLSIFLNVLDLASSRFKVYPYARAALSRRSFCQREQLK